MTPNKYGYRAGKVVSKDEARWMIGNNSTLEKQVPNFIDYIHEDELKLVKPEAVKIIR